MRKITFLYCWFFFQLPLAAAGKQIYLFHDPTVKLYRITASGFLSQKEQARVIPAPEAETILRNCDATADKIMVTLGQDMLNKALSYCRTTPVIFAHVSAPQQAGYRGYPNVTGISFELSLRPYLTELKKLLPRGSHIGFIYSTEQNEFIATEMDYLEAEFNLIGVRKKIDSREKLGETVQELIERDGIAALWVMPDPLYNRAVFRRLAEICREKKIILVTNFEALVKEAGAALALAPSYFDVGLQLAEITTAIEKGISPRNIAFGQPQKIGAYINPAVFAQIGITPPADLRNREKVTLLVDEAQDQLTAGNTAAALTKFREALRLDRQNTVAEYYVRLLEARENYQEANNLLQAGKSLQALPLLISAAATLPEARAKLISLRGELQNQAATLLRNGKEAFHTKKYNQCLQAMNLVLMIDPGNSEAALYREKAQRRAQAVADIR